MVRKMAAINFYVRGLNPGNIQQGDALEKFGTDILPGSKSIVMANPPFGAQRDKESYPNVWSEYSTESETTILFVKLMLEMLEPGGVCAVIAVSYTHLDVYKRQEVGWVLETACGLNPSRGRTPSKKYR